MKITRAIGIYAEAIAVFIGVAILLSTIITSGINLVFKDFVYREYLNALISLFVIYFAFKVAKFTIKQERKAEAEDSGNG